MESTNSTAIISRTQAIDGLETDAGGDAGATTKESGAGATTVSAVQSVVDAPSTKQSQSATEALGTAGGDAAPTTVSPVQSVTDAPSTKQSQLATEALGTTGGDAGVTTVSPVLSVTDAPSTKQSQLATEALGTTGGSCTATTIGPVLSVTDAPSTKQSRSATAALGTTGGEAISSTQSQATTQSMQERLGPMLKWIIAITVSFAAILEVLDTSIVNVALPDMQGNLGATLSEIGWVVTGYSVANAVIIPLTAWLSEKFGRKWYFIFSLVGFTLASVLCGFANSLPMLVGSRILQGLCGGGLLAKAQSILFETFPPEEQGMAQSLFGIGVIVGPVVGPTLGGFLTDTIGWRWIFFINIPFGILAVTMASLFLPKDADKKSQPKKSKSIDWLGIALLVIFISSLQTVLEQGQQDDWFSSNFIITLTVVAIVGFIAFVWQELFRSKAPAVDLRVLRHRSLAAGSIYSLVLGMGLYGAMFAVPIFAQTVLQYTAMQTGMLMLPGALASGLMMPVIGKISQKLDPRLMIALGALGTMGSMVMLASLNINTNESSLFWPLLLRGAATVFMFLPLSMATIGGLPKQDIAAASGFYNLARQMGGSVGVAVLTTILDQRETFHRAILSENFSMNNPLFTNQLNGLTSTVSQSGMPDAHATALQIMSNSMNLQAAVMSFADCFWLVAIMFLVTLPLVLMLSKGSKGVAVDAH